MKKANWLLRGLAILIAGSLLSASTPIGKLFNKEHDLQESVKIVEHEAETEMVDVEEQVVHHEAEYETVHHEAEYETAHREATTKTITHPAEYDIIHHEAEYKTVHHDAVSGKAAWDEQVLVREAYDDIEWETHAFCSGCNADITYEFYTHDCGNAFGTYTNMIAVVKAHHEAEYKTVHHDAVSGKAAWDEQVLVREAWDEKKITKAEWSETINVPAYDEKVLVREAWDERVLLKEAWDETVPAYTEEVVLKEAYDEEIITYTCLVCGKHFEHTEDALEDPCLITTIPNIALGGVIGVCGVVSLFPKRKGQLK